MSVKLIRYKNGIHNLGTGIVLLPITSSNFKWIELFFFKKSEIIFIFYNRINYYLISLNLKVSGYFKMHFWLILGQRKSSSVVFLANIISIGLYQAIIGQKSTKVLKLV